MKNVLGLLFLPFGLLIVIVGYILMQIEFFAQEIKKGIIHLATKIHNQIRGLVQ